LFVQYYNPCKKRYQHIKLLIDLLINWICFLSRPFRFSQLSNGPIKCNCAA